MRVCLVYRDALRPGGYPVDIRTLAEHLSRLGAEVTLAAELPAPERQIALAEGVEVVSLRRLVRTRRHFDLIHVFGLFLPLHLLALTRYAGRSSSVVLSPLSHLQPFGLAKSRGKKTAVLRGTASLLRRLDGVHVFSDTEAASLEPWPGLHTRPAFVASLGVFRPSLEDDPQLASSPSRVLFFGRNDVHQKGIDILIRGFAELARRTDATERTLRLDIAGKPYGESDAAIRRLVSTEGVQNEVTMIGPLTDSERDQKLRDATVLAFLSRFDGPPRPIREALAVGTPCVVSYESNMGELVEEYTAGRATLLDPESVADSLHVALSDERTNEEWRRGAERLRERLSWPAVANSYLAGYRSLT